MRPIKIAQLNGYCLFKPGRNYSGIKKSFSVLHFCCALKYAATFMTELSYIKETVIKLYR